MASSQDAKDAGFKLYHQLVDLAYKKKWLEVEQVINNTENFKVLAETTSWVFDGNHFDDRDATEFTLGTLLCMKLARMKGSDAPFRIALSAFSATSATERQQEHDSFSSRGGFSAAQGNYVARRGHSSGGNYVPPPHFARRL